nr:Biomphalaria glabrata histidine-rich protein PFHRP-III-like [Biomphalaria glabrata]
MPSTLDSDRPATRVQFMGRTGTGISTLTKPFVKNLSPISPKGENPPPLTSPITPKPRIQGPQLSVVEDDLEDSEDLSLEASKLRSERAAEFEIEHNWLLKDETEKRYKRFERTKKQLTIHLPGYHFSLCTPQGSTPQGSTPQGSTPQGSTPQGSTPQGSTPQGSTQLTTRQQTTRQPTEHHKRSKHTTRQQAHHKTAHHKAASTQQDSTQHTTRQQTTRQQAHHKAAHSTPQGSTPQGSTQHTTRQHTTRQHTTRQHTAHHKAAHHKAAHSTPQGSTPQGSTQHTTRQHTTRQHTAHHKAAHSTPQGSTPQVSTPQGSTQHTTRQHTAHHKAAHHKAAHSTPQGSTHHTTRQHTTRQQAHHKAAHSTPQGSTQHTTRQHTTRHHTVHHKAAYSTPQGSTPQGSTQHTTRQHTTRQHTAHHKAAHHKAAHHKAAHQGFDSPSLSLYEDPMEGINNRLEEINSMVKPKIQLLDFLGNFNKEQKERVLSMSRMDSMTMKQERRKLWKSTDYLRHIFKMVYVVTCAANASRRYFYPEDPEAGPSIMRKQRMLHRRRSPGAVKSNLSFELQDTLMTSPKYRTDEQMKKILWLLKTTKAFQNLFPDEMIVELARVVAYERYDHNRHIAYQGRSPELFYFVITGRIHKLREYKLPSGCLNKLIGVMQKGDMSDADEFEHQRQEHLVASGSVEVLILSKPDYSRLLHTTQGLPVEFLLSIDLFKEFPADVFESNASSITYQYYR